MLINRVNVGKECKTHCRGGYRQALGWEGEKKYFAYTIHMHSYKTNVSHLIISRYLLFIRLHGTSDHPSHPRKTFS